MPIKKSALLLILVSASSISLLVFSATIAPPGSVTPAIPGEHIPAKCFNQPKELRVFSTWDVISEIMWKSAA